jgi:hypothetical protein
MRVKPYIKRKGENLMPKIPQSHAHIILRDSARFPTEGTQCDASCAFYWCCANSKDFGECKGFLLLNHGNLDHIKRTYDKNIDEFIENSYQVIQRSLNDGVEINADVLLRNIDQIGKQFSKKQQSLPTSGFIAMVESAHPTTPSEPEPQEPSNSEFQRMLSESGKNTEQPHTIERQIQPWDFEYRLPETCNDGCFAKRFCSSYPRNVGETCVKRWEQYKNKESKF